MSNEFLWQAAASAIATYAVHSTVLMAFAVVLDFKVRKTTAIREWLWKCAAVIPLFSTAFVLCWNDAQPIWEWRSEAVAESKMTSNETGLLATQPDVPPPPKQLTDEESSLPDLAPPGANAASRTRLEVLPREAPSPVPNKAELVVTAVDIESDQTGKEWAIKIVPSANQRPTISDVPPLSDRSKDVRQNEEKNSSKPPTTLVAAANSKLNRVASRELITDVVSDADNNRAVPSACWLMVVVAAIFIAMGWIHFLWNELRITRILNAGRSLTTGPAADVFSQLLIERGVKRKVRLLSSESISEPAATGVLSWKIVLPTDLESRLSESELRALLSHELGHLVRRDTIWQLTGRLLTATAPWQLLNYLAIRNWQQSAEVECDDWSLNSSEDAIALAQVLTNVAEWKTSNGVAIGLSATAPPLSLRIEALLNRADGPRKSRTRIQKLLLAIAIVSTLSGVSAFGPRMVWASMERNVALPQPSGEAMELTSDDQEQLELLYDEFQSLSGDLEIALDLLAGQESDPEVDEAIRKITGRLEEIETNILKGFER